MYNNNKKIENADYSQSAENFENICVMLQKFMEYLNTIKKYPGSPVAGFLWSLKEITVVLKFHCMCSVRIFTRFLRYPYYEPLVWSIIHLKVMWLCIWSHYHLELLFHYLLASVPAPLGAYMLYDHLGLPKLLST